MSINSVNLTGRTTADIEVKVSQNGTHHCSFSLAVENGFGDKKQTYFLPITAFGKTADNIAQFVKKGSKLGITGTLTSSSYTDSQGAKRSKIQVVASNVSFEELKKADVKPQVQADQGNDYSTFQEQAGQLETSDDDLPF